MTNFEKYMKYLLDNPAALQEELAGYSEHLKKAQEEYLAEYEGKDAE